MPLPPSIIFQLCFPPSLVPRPPSRFYLHGCKIKCGWRPGNEATSLPPSGVMLVFSLKILLPWHFLLFSCPLSLPPLTHLNCCPEVLQRPRCGWTLWCTACLCRPQSWRFLHSTWVHWWSHYQQQIQVRTTQLHVCNKFDVSCSWGMQKFRLHQ